MSTLWFRSKVDWWLGVTLVIAPIVSLVGALRAVESLGAAAFLGTGILAAVYLGLVFPMRYGITETELVIRHGLVRQRIKLASIQSVSSTRNPLSSPALSLDRLRVTFGGGFFRKVLISPADKQRFLVELALRARLVRKSDGLVRV